MAHARLSPSNHRWVHCPGSIREEANYPDISGEAAIDGTGSHLLLELCLENNVQAISYEGQVIGVNHEDQPMGWLVTGDRCDRVQIALNYIQRRHRELLEQFPGSRIIVQSESRSNPGELFGRDDWWGTVDITISVVEGELLRFVEIADYKDGRGWVAEKNNSQLLSYLLGKIKTHAYIDGTKNALYLMDIVGDLQFRTTVIQPKTSPPIRYYEPTKDEIRDAARKLIIAARKTDDPEAPLVPGKHCQWCKHGRAKNCTASTEVAIQGIKPMTLPVQTQEGTSLFEVIEQTFGDISQLDDNKLSEIADAEAGILAVFDRVKTEIERRIDSGVQVPGYTMAPGRASQVWAVGEEEVAKALKGRRFKKDEIYPPKLITPGQVLKHSKLTEEQKAKIKRDLITVKAGSLKLKKVDREKNTPTAIDMFSDVVSQCDTVVETTKPVEEISFL